MDEVKIVLLVGTDRPNSQTVVVAERLHEAFVHAGACHVALYNVTDFGQDFYSPDAYTDKPLAFQHFNDAVLAADLIVVVTPEYNATLPAPLARVLNLLQYPASFEGKKYSIVSVSAGPWGGARVHDQLKQVLHHLHAQLDDTVNLKIGNVTDAVKNNTPYAQQAEALIAYAALPSNG